MILRKLKLWNFRKFKGNGETPGLIVEFSRGLNALIGENDSGKSAIVDAIKLVLQTQSGEYVRVKEEDFYSDGKDVATELRIECEFAEFEDCEAKNFVEYISLRKEANGSYERVLFLRFTARREDGHICPILRAGEDNDGVALEGKAREMLRCVYLRPLRDAAKEMRSGRNSRISQILYSHPAFAEKEAHALVKIFEVANRRIADYFETDVQGKVVLGDLRATLERFAAESDVLGADLRTSEMRLKPILESLSLLVSEMQPGLGVSNLLFIAAELLLLTSTPDGSLRLALIEELEAHLHPQAQLRLIEHLQAMYDDAGAQVIISTHSPTLASKINLKNVILVRDGAAYNLAPEQTQLERGDYLFLQRFLDATRANLFFAKSLIMVEGDAENLVLPVIADILGLNLDRHGVSIVKIGGLAFGRYAKIFCRKASPMIRTRIAIVTDCDVKTVMTSDGRIDPRDSETEERIIRVKAAHDCELIKTFVAPHWTFEYSVAMSCLGKDLHRAVLEAKKISNSNGSPLTAKKIEEIEKEIADDAAAKCEGHLFAYHVYKTIMLDQSVSKAVAAQCLAAELRKKVVRSGTIKGEEMFDLDLFRVGVDEAKCGELKAKIEGDENLKYIVDAIKHVVAKGGL